MILVTGATGFLGKRVCKKLEESGISYIPTSLSLGTDLRDYNQTLKFFKKVSPKYILNCASFVGGIQFGEKYSAEIFRNNMLIISNLFEAAKEVGVDKIVNPISNCVYPAQKTLFKESEIWDGPLHESVMVYGMLRKISYIGSYAYNKQFGMNTVNLILSNMYGPEDHFEAERSHALGALIMKFVDAKMRNKPEVVVWGTGKPVREWLHVDDGASAMIQALNVENYIEPINVGVSKGISIKAMAIMIKEIVGYEGDLVYDTSKQDGAAYKTVDGALGEKLLKWKPEIDFFYGVKETISWYISNLSKE